MSDWPTDKLRRLCSSPDPAPGSSPGSPLLRTAVYFLTWGWAPLVSLGILVGCGGEALEDNGPVSVYCAASLIGAMSDVVERYERSAGREIRLSFAASSTLARQIESGAGADVFVSANTKWMDYLEGKDRIVPESRRDFLSNQLVVIAPAGSPFVIEARKDFDFPGSFEGRLSMGDPDHVPAGIYAWEALERFGWAGALKDRLAPAADVREALRKVALGELNAGIVYVSDAISDDRVKIAGRFPKGSHGPITYVAAVVGGADPGGEDFLNYLETEPAVEIFDRYGFTPAAGGGPTPSPGALVISGFNSGLGDLSAAAPSSSLFKSVLSVSSSGEPGDA